MFHLRVMSHELATDGLDNEFEDLIDMVGWLVRPYLEEAGDWAKWEEIAKTGLDILQADDPILWGKKKRIRCEGKMALVMGAMHKNGLLLKRVQKFDPEMEYYSNLAEGKTDG